MNRSVVKRPRKRAAKKRVAGVETPAWFRLDWRWPQTPAPAAVASARPRRPVKGDRVFMRDFYQENVWYPATVNAEWSNGAVGGFFAAYDKTGIGRARSFDEQGKLWSWTDLTPRVPEIPPRGRCLSISRRRCRAG